jgi:hypothetical protein
MEGLLFFYRIISSYFSKSFQNISIYILLLEVYRCRQMVLSIKISPLFPYCAFRWPVTSQDHNCGKMLCKCHEMRQKTLFLVGFFFVLLTQFRWVYQWNAINKFGGWKRHVCDNGEYCFPVCIPVKDKISKPGKETYIYRFMLYGV